MPGIHFIIPIRLLWENDVIRDCLLVSLSVSYGSCVRTHVGAFSVLSELGRSVQLSVVARCTAKSRPAEEGHTV